MSNNPKSYDFGDALRTRRKGMGLTMQYVADNAGLSVGSISQDERGFTASSLASLAPLAKVLKTDITRFLKQPPTTSQTTHKIDRLAYSLTGADVRYERLRFN